MNRFLDELFGESLRVADGGGGEDELRLRVVEACNAFKSANYICNMRTKDAAIGVCFVNDNVF